MTKILTNNVFKKDSSHLYSDGFAEKLIQKI